MQKSMELRDVNLNLLVSLRALLHERGVSRAARSLGLSQPAISNNLAQLRELLGDPLLVRVGNAMHLTPRAEGLVGPLTGALEALERTLAPESRFEPALCQTQFRVVMSEHVQALLLPALVGRLSEAAPRSSLQVFSGGIFDVPDRLSSGNVDALVGVFRSATLGPTFRERDLWTVDMVLIARKGHPLVRRETMRPSMSVEAYAQGSHILVTHTDRATGVVDARHPDLNRHIGSRVTSSSLVPAIVAQSDQLAVIEEDILEAALPHWAVEQVEIELSMPTNTVGLLWHDRTHADPARRFLRSLIKDVAAEHDQARRAGSAARKEGDTVPRGG